MENNGMLVIRLDAELKERLSAAASLEGVSMSEMVRRLIAQAPIIGRVVVDGRVVWRNDKERE